MITPHYFVARITDRNNLPQLKSELCQEARNKGFVPTAILTLRPAWSEAWGDMVGSLAVTCREAGAR